MADNGLAAAGRRGRPALAWVQRAALGCLAIIAWLAGAGVAQAADYAGIVVDMRNGAVYYQDSADRRQQPASLTKMMTLYLTFEALERGQITLDEKVRVSRHAARQPRSKLGMRPGQRVTIRHMIRATAIKSANDAAMVLAETIGGSQAKFAKMMTDKARALGMSRTTFKNPHGLTQRGHLSTARDMALLARHLYFDFPSYYNVFGQKSNFAAGKRVRTTNRLLAVYRGAEGMKTGYTRAAGYNLVAIAARGSERVIAVVLGGRSTGSRNRQAMKLLDLGFRRAPSRVAVKRPTQRRETVLVARSPYPIARPDRRPSRAEIVVAALGPSTASAAVDPSTSPHAPLWAEVPTPSPFRPPSPGDPAWRVRLGSFEREGEAIGLVASLSLSETAVMEGAAVTIGSDTVSGKRRYHVAVNGRREISADAACAALAGIERVCQPVR
ncbi:MAG: serine hydrolase [Pseudomonadota bacterium]